MNFFITLSAVGVMLLYACPGFLLVKVKAVKPEAIPAFSKVLLFFCQPCLIVYSLCRMEYSPGALKSLGICFLFMTAVQIAVILTVFFIFYKKREEIVWRLLPIAAVFSNCGFLGVPLLERLLPDHPEAVAYSSIFSISMNMIGWTLGMYVISREKKYISPVKMILNPAALSFLAALPLFFFRVELPSFLADAVELVGKMSAPLCMIILGMRLATVKMRALFGDWRQYLAVGLNQLLYPLLVFALMLLLPFDPVMKKTLVILCACPVASMVQNYSELLCTGQDKAANMVLLGTVTSVLTVPLVCLII